MAVTQTQALPAPFITALGEKYGAGLGSLAGQKLTDVDPATGQPLLAGVRPTVAPQTALQQQATTLAGQVAPGGVAAYEPYITGAGGAGMAPGAAIQGATAAGILGQAGTQLGAAETGLAGIAPYAGQTVQDLAGAQTTLAGVSPYITGAAGLTGAGAGTGTGSIAEYMSPYQSQVIDTTLEEFDRQAAMRQQAISDAAVGIGGYGGGREGVLQSEYQTQSDRNRAALEAQMQQQGFTQAQAARQTDLASRLGIGGAQQSMAAQQGALAQGYLAPGQLMAGVAGQQAGMAGQRAALGQAQLGLGQYQTGLAGTTQALRQADIGTLGQVGALDQAQLQAEEDARREYNRMTLYEPYERLGFFGQGLTGLMGGYPAQYQFAQQPNVSPLAGALGIASTVGGLYGNIYGRKS